MGQPERWTVLSGAENVLELSVVTPVKPGQFPLKVAALAVLPFDADIN